MAVKYVTREVIEFHREVKYVDLDTDEVRTQTYVNIPIRKIQQLLKAVNGQFVCVSKETKTKRLLGVDVDTFRDIGVELDPKTRKPINNNN